MAAPSRSSVTWTLREDIFLYVGKLITSRISFAIGLALPLLFLHHIYPSTLLALLLLFLTIILFKCLFDLLYLCFVACPYLWTYIILLSYSWWYLRSLL